MDAADQHINNVQARLFVALNVPANVVQEVERIREYFKSKNL